LFSSRFLSVRVLQNRVSKPSPMIGANFFFGDWHVVLIHHSLLVLVWEYKQRERTCETINPRE
jgi:hypothetical protein